MTISADSIELKPERVCLVPLGGQSEVGRALWAICHAGEILLIDAGASYPGPNLPGVDLLLPNTAFLEAYKERIVALVLTNGHEEHSGAVPFLLNRLHIKRMYAPRFVASLIAQRDGSEFSGAPSLTVEMVETRRSYQIGPFSVEWIQVNDAIADACALRIGTAEGQILYTSSFKLDQTPIDGRQMDIGRLAQLGDQGLQLLISDSAGVENPHYTPSEKSVANRLERIVGLADGRVLVALPGTNTLRLQVLFDLAKKFNRKVILSGEALVQSAIAAALTGNLAYDRNIESTITGMGELAEEKILILVTGEYGDAMQAVSDLAYGKHRELSLKKGDTVVFSSEIFPGESRKMAMILDQFLALGVVAYTSARSGVHVSNHAGREELKLMLSVAKPIYFIPALGEGRHIMHHAQLAGEFGVPSDCIFPLRNGDVLELHAGSASVIGSVEAQAIFYNRDQAESVTSFSVNERRALCQEGVLSVGLLLDENKQLMAEPVLEGAALGFVNSREWDSLKPALLQAVKDVVATNGKELEVGPLRSVIRELITKNMRARLQAKPTIQVIIHELVTSRPG